MPSEIKSKIGRGSFLLICFIMIILMGIKPALAGYELTLIGIILLACMLGIGLNEWIIG